MKVGLIGEAPNDTKSITNLFQKEYPNCQFITLINNINGSNLENQKIKSFLRKEYEFEKPDLIIFIRDLDALESDSTQLNLRKKYFTNYNSIVDRKGMFLLHIYEIEALILADIDTFNSIYNVKIDFKEDSMLVSEPKEYLQSKCKKYKPSDNSFIFEKLNFKKLLNCRYFENFINNFENAIN